MQIAPLTVAQAFGEALRDARENEGQTQEQLAARARLNRTHISFLERGLRQPTLFSLFSLANALSMRTSELIASVERILRRRKKA